MVLRDIYLEQDALKSFGDVLHARIPPIPTPPPSPGIRASPLLSLAGSEESLWGQVDPITPAHAVAAAVGERYGRVPFNFVNGQSLAIGM